MGRRLQKALFVQGTVAVTSIRVGDGDTPGHGLQTGAGVLSIRSFPHAPVSVAGPERGPFLAPGSVQDPRPVKFPRSG